MTVVLELLGVAVLILLNGFFVAAEYSLVTVRRTRLKELIDEGNRPARAVMKITSDPAHFIAAMQLGVTLTSLAIGAIGEQVLSELFGVYLGTFLAVVLAFFVITFMHVVIGELVPKGLALSYSERIALGVSVPVRAFFFVAAPLIWVLQRSSEGVQRLIGIDPDYTDGEAHSEAELKMLLEVSTQRGEIEQGEREMLYKVFDFADKEASDVMVPRPEVVGISIEMAPEEALKAVLESPYTRYPVFRESLDEIVGILHVRDLVSALHDSAIAEVELAALLRPAYVVPETKDLAALLAEFRRTNQHMSVVVDEYGAMQGIVTLEDLLEEIVGEIEDEFDLPDESIERIDETTIRIDGTFPIDDFNEELGTAIEHEDFHTVAGYVFDLIGRAAEPGDEVLTDGLRFTVLDVEGSRIQRIEVEFLPTPEPAGDKEGEAA
jgi:CBS domain containing-hemolysin-like protein